MVPCSHAHLLKHSTPAIADNTLSAANNTLGLRPYGSGLMPSGPLKVLRFYLLEARSVILPLLTYITLLISLSFVVFKLNLQNQGSVALNGTINALRRCGESPPISVFVPVARILDQNFTT